MEAAAAINEVVEEAASGEGAQIEEPLEAVPEEDEDLASSRHSASRSTYLGGPPSSAPGSSAFHDPNKIAAAALAKATDTEKEWQLTMRKAYHMFLREKLAAEGEAIQAEMKRQRGPSPPRAKRLDISFEHVIAMRGIQIDGDTFETAPESAENTKWLARNAEASAALAATDQLEPGDGAQARGSLPADAGPESLAKPMEGENAQDGNEPTPDEAVQAEGGGAEQIDAVFILDQPMRFEPYTLADFGDVEGGELPAGKFVDPAEVAAPVEEAVEGNDDLFMAAAAEVEGEEE